MLASTFYDFSATSIGGQNISMSDYAGKVVVVVNTASKCGFTPQYAGLEELYKKYKDRGLVILGFPCDQFGHQEPAENSDIQSFCKLNYGVSFPMFGKTSVNGSETHPLYAYLKKEAPGFLGTSAIKWNFTKFLVDRKGHVVKRFASKDEPSEMVKDIESLL